jgi:cellulose synthase/poly-beta-1,6-N-acetylglucosamine synthase-like glycosyltransferase
MILEQLFLMTAVVGAIMALMQVIGAHVYDAREINKQRRLSLHPHARQYRRRPLISVIVSAHNDERVIERCLDSLSRSTYHKFEVIVIDSASQDQTKTIVKRFIAEHPRKAIRLFARKNVSQISTTIKIGYKKYGSGELILLLTAQDIVDRQALNKAVRYFNAESDIGAISLRRRLLSNLTAIGLLQHYIELLGHRSQKFTSMSHTGYISAYVRTSGAAMYRRETLLGNNKLRAYYASDVIAYTEPLPSLYRLMQKHYRLQLDHLQALRDRRRLVPFTVCAGLAALCVPVLLSYFIYLAVSLHEPTFLLLSWVALSVWLLTAIWGDQQLRLWHKATYSTLIPVTYALFYIISFVPIFVTLGAAVSRRRLPSNAIWYS